jgi:hypothetical protein
VRTPDGYVTTEVDIDVPLPEIWTFEPVDPDRRGVVEAELVELLGEHVDDPEAVAAVAYDEFMERVGAGTAPLLIASFREEMDDGSLLSASLNVTRNEVTGDLDAWSDAFADATELTVAGESALRTFARSTVEVTGLFDEPITVSTWRYVVAFDPRSVLLFTFSSPNSDLDDLFEEHFDAIMSEVHIGPSTAIDDDPGPVAGDPQ